MSGVTDAPGGGTPGASALLGSGTTPGDRHGAILSVDNVSLSFTRHAGLLRRETLPVLNGVSLTLRRGETLGIIGRNGCGKSSLLRVMAGILRPTSGRVVVDVATTRAILALGLGFRNDLSGRDNALLSAMLQGLSRTEARAVLDEICDFAELDSAFDRPVGTYSSGMRARLGFATALISHVDILFIDEVLGVGDGAFRHKAAEALKGRIRGDQTVVMVSHNLEEVGKLCDRVLRLDAGEVAESGESRSVLENYRSSLRA